MAAARAGERALEQRQLGRTGVRVSALGFGGAPAGLTDYLGAWDANADSSASAVVDAIRRALDLGITYFDTAPGYGEGRSEEIFGRGLSADRARIFLATKVSARDWNSPALQASIEGSLRRLRTDHLDLIQYHGGWLTELDADRLLDAETLALCARLREEGKIRFVGFTAEGQTGATERAIASGTFDTVMLPYSLTHQMTGAYRNRNLPEATALSRARECGLGTIAMRTLTSGLFPRWLGAIGANETFDWNRALLAFVLSHPQIDVALVGMRTAQEVDRNVAATDPRWRVDHAELHDGYGAARERGHP